jgi:hypothetical protein
MRRRLPGLLRIDGSVYNAVGRNVALSRTMKPEMSTSSWASCVVALLSLRGSHGATKPQNSASAAGGRPRADAQASALDATQAAATRRVPRSSRFLTRTRNLVVTVGKLADSSLFALEVDRMPVFRHPVFVLFLAVAAACSGRDKSSAQAVGDTVGAAHHEVIVARSPTSYNGGTVTGGGRITGVVSFTGTAPGDTAIIVPADQNGCGKPLTVQLLARSNGKVANAVVWLTDVRQGKPLPTQRRFQLTNDDCAWDPQVQTAVAGGALNVVNYDPLAENVFATSVATGDTVAFAPFTDDGQVIPYDKLLRTPAVLEFSVESRPMSRAWVVVLDQPYFAITDAAGSFTMDSVPPGVHHIRAWHPMLGIVDGTVTVSANGTATANLQFHPQ